jgi:hypothetical protein
MRATNILNVYDSSGFIITGNLEKKKNPLQTLSDDWLSAGSPSTSIMRR